MLFKINLQNEVIVIPQFSMLEPGESKTIKLFLSCPSVDLSSISIELESVVFSTEYIEVLADAN